MGPADPARGDTCGAGHGGVERARAVRRREHLRSVEGLARRGRRDVAGRDPRRAGRRVRPGRQLPGGVVTVLTPALVRELAAAPSLLAQAAPGDLRVASLLREKWPAYLVAAATSQVALRARAAGRLRDASSMMLTAAGLEQATSTVVAAHRAARIAASSAGGA